MERRGDPRPEQALVGDLVDARGGLLGEHEGEDAVVGPHETLPARFEGQRAPGRADAGVDDGQERRAGRERAAGGGEGEGGRHHVVRRQVVGEVHDGRLAAGREHRAAHRPRIVILAAEVGEQRDDGPHLWRGSYDETARPDTRG